VRGEGSGGEKHGKGQFSRWRSGCLAFACCVLVVFEMCLLWSTRKSRKKETT
jgi:hypothetical protein